MKHSIVKKNRRENLDNPFINPLPNFGCHSIYERTLLAKKNPRGKNVGNFQKIKKNIKNSQNVPKPEKYNAKSVLSHL